MPKTARFTSPKRKFIALIAALFATSVFIHQMYTAREARAVSTSVVISQVYGGGGNAGATYKNDFIELFNRGTSPVSLSGWSVQYASAAGTTWAVTNLTNVTLQPGQYYLVQEALGAGGTVNLPTPDASGTIAMSATAGKVALVNSTTALTGSGCPFAASLVDFVGFGGANCSETAPTPLLSNTTAAIRNVAGCTDTDNNSSDFATGAPTPRNTASAFNVCPGGTPTPTPTPTPTLSINNVTQNETNAGPTTFTFTVSLSSPALAGGVNFTVNTADGTTNPANAGSDYVAIVGGSGSIAAGSSSTTVNVTVNGDTTPEPNETFFVNLSSITGTTNSSAQGLGTIANDDVTLTPIYTIQGSGMQSPLSGSVSTSGIVTGKRSFGTANYGFYIQDSVGDGNPNTSDAILVFQGSTVPSVNVGDAVQVTGTVSEFESSTTDEPDGTAPPDPKTATEIVGPLTISVLSTSNPLPAAIDVTSNDILGSSFTSRGAQLEKFEYMRLSISSLTVSEPTNNFGEFYGVETGKPRPFREAGIEAGDPIPNADEPPYAPGPPPFPPRFDGNFERIMIDSGAALTTGSTRRPQVQVTTGTVVTNLVGPLDYTFDAYRIVLDSNVTPGTSGGIAAAVPVRSRLAGEVTIGHANLENFGASNAGFAGRLNKASLAIRNIMQTPDILGVIEVFDLASLQQLATKVNNDYGNPAVVNYVAYLDEGAPTFGDDQDIGYLVNSARVTVVGAPVQYHRNDTFTYGTATDILHDRPSYVLTADVPRNGGGTVRVKVVLNHTKSLIAVDSPRPRAGGGTEGARNREKRRLQAEDIADLIETLQTDNLVVLGDLNAFDFNDGLGDIVGTLKGAPVSADQVVEPSVDRWTFTLTNLLYTLTSDQQYSLLFEGNAQALDHVLVNNAMLAHNTGFAYARYNSDFSESFAADTTRPERLADHDAAVSYYLFAGDPDGDGVEDPADNCPNVANPDQANNDGDSLGDVCDPDDDNDGVLDGNDNCPFNLNADQTDTDGDTLGDACDPDDDNDGIVDTADNCPLNANADQANNDGDALGDACDPDDDNDGVVDTADNCPLNANADQANNDGDALGDACDPDDDNDGILDGADNCPTTANANQANNDGDSSGDVCDADDDNDGVLDGADNCPLTTNADQADGDGDGIGNACDPNLNDGPTGDLDGDAVLNNADNCPTTANTNQANNDGDAEGDVCDADDDNDGVLDGADNCPLTANADQADGDGDGIGNACDSNLNDGPTGDLDGDGVLNGADNCPTTANANQANNDGDALGDVCDADDDNDGVLDGADNCPLTANADQADGDGDGIGNACDPNLNDGPTGDLDGDGVLNNADNCPTTPNANQSDIDNDGIGDACDTAIGPPTNKDQCKNGGWQLFNSPSFPNQGACVSYVNHHQPSASLQFTKSELANNLYAYLLVRR